MYAQSPFKNYKLMRPTAHKINVTKRTEETQQHCQCRMCQIFCTCSPTSCRHFSNQCQQACYVGKIAQTHTVPRRLRRNKEIMNSHKRLRYTDVQLQPPSRTILVRMTRHPFETEQKEKKRNEMQIESTTLRE